MAEQPAPPSPRKPVNGARPSTVVDDRLVRPVRLRSPILIGLGIIAVFFGGFLGWAVLAPLESAAIAPGVVKVDTNRKTLQHLEGGIVGEILVRDGDQVTAGQVMIRLDETQPRAQLEILKGRYAVASALEARLIAERDGRDEIEFPSRLLSRRGELQADEILDGQVSIFKARREALAALIAVLNQRKGEYSEEIYGLEGQITAKNKQLQLVKDQISSVRTLVEKEMVPKTQLQNLEHRAAGIEGSRSQHLTDIARIKQKIDEARLRVAELQATQTSEVVQQLQDVQTQLFDLAEKLRSAEDVLRRTDIRAPLDGTVVDLRLHTPGGVIAPGEQLLSIVPSADRLVIEARVNPNDIDVVFQGQAVQVRLTPFNQRNMPPIEGWVTSISADRMTDQRNGQFYFLSRIEVTDEAADVLDGVSLYPGMPAEVMIMTGARSAIGYFFKPITASMNRAFRED